MIRQYFGSIDLRALDNFDEASQTFSLEIQSFGSTTVPKVVERATMPDNKIKLTVDNINPDLPDEHKVVKRRDYVFLKTEHGYILQSAELISYNPPPPPVEGRLENWYECVVNDLSSTINIARNKAVVSVKNNGSEAAEFVQGTALFFLNGKLVSHDKTYFTDDGSEIKPGKTIIKELTCYEKFDSVKVYFTGRR